MTNLKRVKITHDGSADVVFGSGIRDADTGEHLSGVRRIEVVLDVREPPRAIVYLERAELDITTEAELTQYERGMVERIADAVEMRLSGLIRVYFQDILRELAHNVPLTHSEAPAQPKGVGVLLCANDIECDSVRGAQIKGDTV